MKRVLIESPFAGDVQRNIRYAKACVMDCLKRGEAPYASHLFFTLEGLLDDNIPEERALGIEAGLIWGQAAECTVVYTDLGISEGMEGGIERARKEGREVKIRRLGGEWTEKGTFAGLVRCDLEDIDNIDDYIDEWHESDSTLSLSEYLGLSEDEYKSFLKTGELFFLLKNRKK
jgi:hypothetical protein